MAAALGNVDARDNWKVHFRDTMRGGKFLNDWRMAELHARHAPERVRELEELGRGVRPHQGRPHQPAQLRRPPLPAPRPRRRSHRPRDDPHAAGPRRPPGHRGPHGVHARSSCCSTTAGSPACSPTGARPAASSCSAPRRSILATGGGGKAWRITSNSWEYTGDGIAHRLRRRRRADGHGVHAVPPHRHGVAAVGARHPGHRGRARRRRHPASTTRASASCSTTSRPSSPPRRRTRWRRPIAGSPATRTRAARPSCSPATWSRARSRAEVKAGRGSPHGGVFLDIASRRPADFIKRKLPSMYHQFKELAEVDITKEPMEVGPTLHYFMGGIRVDADTPDVEGAGPVRRRRVRRRHARRQPARRQLALRPARVRRARRRRRRGVRRARSSSRRRSTTPRSIAAIRARDRRPQPRAGHEPVPGARGPAERDGRATSASCAQGRARAGLEGARAHQGATSSASRRRARASTTRAGTRRSRCARCSITAEAVDARRAACARRAAARTRASTSRASATSGSSTTSSSARRRTARWRSRSVRAPAPPPELAADRATPKIEDLGGAARSARSASRERAVTMAERARSASGAATPSGGEFVDYQVADRARAWSCSTSSTASRPARPTTSRCAGTARPASAARAAWRSTASRSSSCMTRMNDYAEDETITVQPLKTFPVIKDLVTDVSWNYEQNKTHHAVHAAPARCRRQLPDDAGGRRSHPGVPQVHRVLPVPGRLPRAARPRRRRTSSSARAS